MARLTLTDPQDPTALMQMALEYDLDIGTAQTWDVASAYVPAILDLGRRVAKGPTNVMRAIESGGTVEVEGEPGPGGVIDFGDMVWLPTVEDLYPHQRPYVMIDEAQDLNRAQLELVLRAVEPGGRTLAVGDAGQAIYGWAGADFHSMDRIAQRTGARSMPLSICYRCPASHVALAATVHPQIEPRPNAPEGVIEGNVPEEDAVRRMTPGDLVISRVNAPLVPMAYEMIRMGVPARVRGRDIGKGLCALVHRVAEQAGCTLRDFPRWVEHYREAQEAEVIRRGKEGVEMALVSLRDRCETVAAIYQSLKPPTLERFVTAVQELFSDEAKGVVWLSTIHRAKGDETERVYILRPDLLPHPRARTPQQQEQEQNLRYVAFTRAKEALYFVGGPAPRGWA
jgi:hypothetical protein